MNEPTIFHKILTGEVPCHKIYEDEHTLAFLDIYPKNEGHTVIIPKKTDAQYVWHMTDEEYEPLMRTTKKVAQRLDSVLNFERIHCAVYGVEVPYPHIQLVPFDDASEMYLPGRENIEPDIAELERLAARLRF